MQGLTPELIRGMAARHWRAGVDGIYLFNGPGVLRGYDVDAREVLDQAGSPRSLRHRDKRYAVMRRTGSFPNCYPQQYLLPAELGPEAAIFPIDVADDVAGAGARIDHVHLELLLKEPCHLDELTVTCNGTPLPCLNPLEAGKPAPGLQGLAGLRPRRCPAQAGPERGRRVREAGRSPCRGDSPGAHRPGAVRPLPVP